MDGFQRGIGHQINDLIVTLRYVHTKTFVEAHAILFSQLGSGTIRFKRMVSNSSFVCIRVPTFAIEV